MPRLGDAGGPVEARPVPDAREAPGDGAVESREAAEDLRAADMGKVVAVPDGTDDDMGDARQGPEVGTEPIGRGPLARIIHKELVNNPG